MKLERIEISILIFLVATLVLGTAISALRKVHPPAVVTIEKFNVERYKAANDNLDTLGESVDINSASAEDLEKIKGIGPAIAGRIVEYRDQNGSFASIDDIKNVKGVGVALFEKIKSRITVE